MTTNRSQGDSQSDVAAQYPEHEIEVYLTITTTHEDVQACLERSGIVAGALIGEALIGSVEVYSPEAESDG